jgi:hypothetical protein
MLVTAVTQCSIYFAVVYDSRVMEEEEELRTSEALTWVQGYTIRQSEILKYVRNL